MHRLNAIQIRDKFLKGGLSAAEIASHYLNRIQRFDPEIGAFLTVYNDKVHAQAERLDKKLKAGKPLGKLAGIPIAVKDNIHVKNELTTCASKFLANYRAPFESTVTGLLQEEDALLIGKTNMDEFAMGSSTENSAFQITHNPWNLDYSPGGSSGGSAAAVAARLVPISLGTDTGGSIRQPAAYCGLVGFKPSYGRVSRFGLVGVGSSLDQIGPLTTCTEDAALIMEVIGKGCENDYTSLQLPADNYINQLDGKVCGLKIGVPREFLKEMSHENQRLFEEALTDLKSLGMKIVEIDLNILNSSVLVYYVIASVEAASNLARFDGIRYGVRSSKAKSLEEVYSLSRAEGFGPEVKFRIMLGTYLLSSIAQEDYYRKAQKARTLIIDGYKRAFSKCDLIATPTTKSGAFSLGTQKDSLSRCFADTYNVGVNLAGLPAISIPHGYTSDQMPVGLQLIGPNRQDAQVLRVAHALEQAIKYKQKLFSDFVTKNVEA